MITLLALSGSLRLGSSNTVLLEAAALLAPAGMRIAAYDGIGSLPHFNPDLDGDNPPRSVMALRHLVGAADGLIISCPEYARGIPGSFKNALDWLVGSSEFPGKPIALFNASPRASDAQAALRLVLTTMSARIVEEASITLPLLATRMDAAGMAGNVEIAASVTAALAAFARAIETFAQAEPGGSG
ncbi:NADPH-dependent FMN reductase [Labrys neptuniae]|uniref:NADPH-dependent FMN reductase n=1 Tax=Labrys neptuniae TaxID=376174 RepID=A0ABV3PK06_9HYPH